MMDKKLGRPKLSRGSQVFEREYYAEATIDGSE